MSRKMNVFGTLNRAMCWRQKSRKFLGGDGCAGFQFDERARRFTPFFVRLGDDGGAEHGGMAIERFLDLDGRDILAAGNDDVL